MKLKLFIVVFLFLILIYLAPIIFVIIVEKTAMILPPKYIFSNKFTSQIFRGVVPYNKDTLCYIANNIWKENQYHIYKYETNIANFSLESISNNLDSSMEGDRVIAFTSNKAYVFDALPYYKENAKPGYDEINNNAINSRIDYGFKEVTAEDICDIASNSLEIQRR